MVQNKEIKMCVLGISGAFQATYEFWPGGRSTCTDNEVSHLYFFILEHFQAIYPHMGRLWDDTLACDFHSFSIQKTYKHILQTSIVCQFYSLRGLRKHRLSVLVLPKTLWFIDLPCVVPQRPAVGLSRPRSLLCTHSLHGLTDVLAKENITSKRQGLVPVVQSANKIKSWIKSNSCFDLLANE